MAGLEHTGHHLWHDKVSKLLNVTVKNYMTLLMSKMDKTDRKRYKTVEYLTAKLTSELRDTSSRYFFIPSCSYPCGRKGEEHNPKLQTFISLQRQIGVIPKYVIMLRKPLYEIVNTFDLERVHTLLTACRCLLDDISYLRDHEFTCLEYHRSVVDAPRISKFLGINITSAMKASFRETTRQSMAHLHMKNLWNTTAWADLTRCDQKIWARCESKFI